MKKIVLYIASLLVLSACSDEIANQTVDNEVKNCITVIKERPNGVWKPYNYVSKLKRKSIQIPQLSHVDYLGYSLKTEEYPIEDTRNVGYRVINTESFFKDYPAYFQAWKNKASESSYFAYADFNDYQTKSDVTKKVNSGLNLHFLCFSLSNKTKITKTFSSDVISNANCALGELNIVVRDSNFRMQYSDNIRSKIVKGYLDQTFLEELRLTHPYEFYKNYGGFVMRDFATGGRATVLYSGVHKYSSDTKVKTSDMSDEIESSFSLKQSSNPNSASLSFGRGNSSSSSFVSKFNGSKLSVKTLGGESSFGSFSIPQDVETTSIDMSGWMASLGTPYNQSLCEFNDNGLIPITDFILERNLKDNINSYIKGNIPSKIKIIEPYICIDTANWDPAFCLLMANFVTRYGDSITLDIESFNESDQDVEYQLRNWAEEIGNNFNMKVLYYTPIIESNYSKIRITRSQDFTGVAKNISLAKRFEHNGIIYIIDEKEKVGFSIPNIPQYIEEYGWTDIINNMSTSSLRYEDLWSNEFYIYAL